MQPGVSLGSWREKLRFIHFSHLSDFPLRMLDSLATSICLCLCSQESFCCATKCTHLRCCISEKFCLTAEDEALIKTLWEHGYNAKRIMRELPRPNFKLSTPSYVLKKLNETGQTAQRRGMEVPEVPEIRMSLIK